MAVLEMAVDGQDRPALQFRAMSHPAKPTLDVLEKSIGYKFAARSLLEQALTHISAISGSKRIESYQRLEFLGDRVLGLAVADMLFRKFPDEEEGVLSRRLSDLVRKETCAQVASEWNVGAYLRLGGGERQSGGRKRLTILGDACEALIGAVFLDSGYDAARKMVEKAWSQRLLQEDAPTADAKTALQEWAQAQGLRTPTYSLVSRSGPDHKPLFVVSVNVDPWPSVEGHGHSKRVAEQAAAEAFMRSVVSKPIGEPSDRPSEKS